MREILDEGEIALLKSYVSECPSGYNSFWTLGGEYLVNGCQSVFFKKNWALIQEERLNPWSLFTSIWPCSEEFALYKT
jgi:hypothetical protein